MVHLGVLVTVCLLFEGVCSASPIPYVLHVVVEHGSTLTLPCNGSAYVEEAGSLGEDEVEFRWEAMGADVAFIRGGELVEGEGYQGRVQLAPEEKIQEGDWSLVLDRVMLRDADMYECIWEGRRTISTVWLKVKEPSPERSAVVWLGDSVRLLCYIPVPKGQSYEDLYVWWTRNGRTVAVHGQGDVEVDDDDPSRFTIWPDRATDDFGLIISPVLINDHGEYRCLYKTRSSEEMRPGIPESITLTVLGTEPTVIVDTMETETWTPETQTNISPWTELETETWTPETQTDMSPWTELETETWTPETQTDTSPWTELETETWTPETQTDTSPWTELETETWTPETQTDMSPWTELETETWTPETQTDMSPWTELETETWTPETQTDMSPWTELETETWTPETQTDMSPWTELETETWTPETQTDMSPWTELETETWTPETQTDMSPWTELETETWTPETQTDMSPWTELETETWTPETQTDMSPWTELETETWTPETQTDMSPWTELETETVTEISTQGGTEALTTESQTDPSPVLLKDSTQPEQVATTSQPMEAMEDTATSFPVEVEGTLKRWSDAVQWETLPWILIGLIAGVLVVTAVTLCILGALHKI